MSQYQYHQYQYYIVLNGIGIDIDIGIRPIPIPFNTNTVLRRFLSFVFAITSLALVTVLYVGSSTNNFSTDLSKFQFYSINNQTQLLTIRVLCLILTSPKNFLTRAKAVNNTWASRCDRHFFITEYIRESLTPEELQFAEQIPIAPIKNITPGYDHLTQKSTLAFLFAYKKYFKDFDWFIKADDDTYMIIENLKMFLSQQDPSEPVTFGYNFKVNVPKGYHSGGASYVLSREALRRFHQAHQNPKSDCRKDGGSEDVEIAKCLRSKGVYPGKSLDKQNRELFHPLPFADHFRGSFPDWLRQYAENPLGTSYNCCSDQTISFHYVNPDDQYLMDFLLYKVGSLSYVARNFFHK